MTGGVYHSIYDDFYWYTHFSDTDFVYGRALAQTAGTAVMRMADADLLPLSFGDSAETIAGYVKELEAQLKKQQEEASERDRELDEGIFAATSDPQKTFVAPPREPLPPFIDFSPLENGSAAYTKSAAHFERALARAQADGGAAYARQAVRQLNQHLIDSAQGFAYAPGLPERPWYKNQIYAPGAYTGYGVKTIPAVRESLDEKKWKQAEEGAATVGKVLENEAQMVEAAAVELEALSKDGQPTSGGEKMKTLLALLLCAASTLAQQTKPKITFDEFFDSVEFKSVEHLPRRSRGGDRDRARRLERGALPQGPLALSRWPHRAAHAERTGRRSAMVARRKMDRLHLRPQTAAR